MQLRGTLIAIGGNEDKGARTRPLHVHDTVHAFIDAGILCRIVAAINNADTCLEVVTTASSIPKSVAYQHTQAFKKLGHANVRTMHIIHWWMRKCPGWMAISYWSG